MNDLDKNNFDKVYDYKKNSNSCEFKISAGLSHVPSCKVTLEDPSLKIISLKMRRWRGAYVDRKSCKRPF